MTSNTKDPILVRALQSFLEKYPRDTSDIDRKIDELSKKREDRPEPDIKRIIDLILLNFAGYIGDGVMLLDVIYKAYTVAASAIDENDKLQEVIDNPLTGETERAKLLERQSENTGYLAQAVDQIGDLLMRLYTEWLVNAIIPPAVTVEDVRKVSKDVELGDNG